MENNSVKLLCDIGNTHFHFYYKNQIIDTKRCNVKKIKIYYISVNEKKEKELIKKNPESINLAKAVQFDTNYIGLGIDRVMACKSIENGVVIDAGSAITIDVMNNNTHLGGYILPGIFALNRCYGEISKKLEHNFNMNVEKDALPTNTIDAISFGGIGMIINFIEKVAKDKKIYFTGGDGAYLSRFFDNSVYIKDLVFRGMLKTIKENNL